MLVYDSSKTASIRHATAVEEQRENTLRWIKEQTKNCQVDDSDPLANPTHVASRIGTPMHADVLEKRLKTLNPSLYFRWNEFNSTKKAMYRSTPSGLEYLFAYESGIMPERSIMNVEEEMIPDPQVFQPGFVMERSEFKPDGSNPYYRPVRKVWNEKTRGWRTVLLKLVNCGLLTPTQVETTFGSVDTPEWQGHIGKAPVTTPW